MRDRMYAYIFPNTPRTDSEKAAFEKAIRYQYEHEATAAMNGQQVPNGVTEFSIGDFSMHFEDGMFSSAITRKTICSSAYGVLLREGLLYKGIEGRR